MPSSAFLQTERKAVFLLAAVSGLRLFGLFMILPVLTLHIQTFTDATPTLLGLALGIYGLMQAMLQLPLGRLSDRIGRIPVIRGGLILFIVGSIVAAISHSFYGLILGRALQGAGAVSSAVIAAVADLTRDAVRTRAMAVMGISIAFCFVSAMVLAPTLDAWVGLSGIFWLSAGLASCALIAVGRYLTHAEIKPHLKTSVLQVLLTQRQLWPYQFSSFFLHAILTLIFVGIPVVLKSQFDLVGSQVSLMYLGVFSAAVLVLAPLLRRGDTEIQSKSIIMLAVLLLSVSIGLFCCVPSTLWVWVVALIAFFIGFNALEAMLPAELSKQASPEFRGTAMGLYSTLQFLGTFLGGALGGMLYSTVGLDAVFRVAFVLCVVWLLVNRLLQKR